MIHTTVTPVNTEVNLTIPKEYIGKKVEVLLYTLEEAEPKHATVKKNKPSDYAGTLSLQAATQFLKHIEESRNEWEKKYLIDTNTLIEFQSISRNVVDFKKIKGLNVIDPWNL